MRHLAEAPRRMRRGEERERRRSHSPSAAGLRVHQGFRPSSRATTWWGSGSLARMSDRHPLPGFVTAHSHAFQRAMRGRAQGDDFWGWREAMLEVAEGLTPDGVRSAYEDTYREMRAAGYTAVGEFHLSLIHI